MDNTKVLELKKDVKWIGMLDPELVTFDVVMETWYGTTYNSYFIDGDKKVVIETAKEKYKDEYFAKLRKVVNPEEIDYIILNHTEPDHSGCLKELLKIAPNATVIATKIGIKFLKDILNQDFNHIIATENQTLDLGNKTLRFFMAPFLHWPDTMYTYLEEDNILFSCDSFGCHYCKEEMYNDLVGDFTDAFDYYFRVIMSPYSEFALKAIEKVEKLDIDIIAPGHGPILRDDWQYWVNRTKEHAINIMSNRTGGNPKVFIPYVSAYGNTARIAEILKNTIIKMGKIEVKTMNIQDKKPEDYMLEIEKADAILIGSPTITQNTFPQIYNLFGAINPVTSKGKICGAFGSYGWSGEGVEIVHSILKSLKLRPAGEGLKVLFVPKDGEDNECVEFAKEIGNKILEKYPEANN